MTSIKCCVVCGAVFEAVQSRAIYCSKRCKLAGWKANNPERAAEHRAREAERVRAIRAAVPPRMANCKICGVVVFGSRSFCDECNAETNRRKAREYFANLRELERQARPLKQCKECGVDYKPTHLSMLFCSHACTARNARRVRAQRIRAVEAGARAERLDAIAVFERDGWRCHICKRKTPRDKRGTYAPNAPELDHIVPLSKGGAHTRANTACCCRECNGRKGAKVLGQPSLLALVA